jgi:hypothetical protein
MIQKVLFLLVLLLPGSLFSCSKKVSFETSAPPSPQPAVQPQAVSAPTEWIHPLLIIESGDNPLWFEFKDDGPSLISSPGEASLKLFEPWTLARMSRGMVMQDTRLTIAINREGFLTSLPRDDARIALYRIAEPAYWSKYTIGSFFVFEGNPAALLYRDDFFVDPLASPPLPRVVAQVNGNPHPVGVSIPALEWFPPSEGWDVETLRQGPDGYWYYRGIQKVSAQAAHRYFRTDALSHVGEAISVAAFRNSALPEPLNKAPPLLQAALTEMFRLNAPNQLIIAGIISPEFPYTRYFGVSSPAAQDNLVELSGYYIGTDSALVLFPNGTGVFGSVQGSGDFKITPFSLPSLPEGFVYTGVGVSGKTIIAAWEEQQGWNVGAAGLMVIRAPVN